MKKVGVLFDLDGVLIDSEDLYTEFWEGIEHIYPTNIPDFAHIIKGNALFKILNTYYPRHLHQDIIDRVHSFELNMVYPIYDGVIDFLEELKSRNLPCAIVTSSDNVKMETLYRQYPFFKPYFSAIITGSDVTKSKPDPQGYLLAAKAIGCNPCDCYVFEDSLQGLDAGMASGATVIALTTSNSLDMVKEKAHEVIENLAGYTVDKMLSVNRD